MLHNFIDVYHKYADFSGRATRRQYWEWFFVCVLASVIVALLDYTTNGKGIFSNIFSLINFVPSLGVGARRLHDTGRSGWWQLIVLVPVVGLFVLIYFLCLPTSLNDTYGKHRSPVNFGPGRDSEDKDPPKPPFIIKG